MWRGNRRGVADVLRGVFVWRGACVVGAVDGCHGCADEGGGDEGGVEEVGD